MKNLSEFFLWPCFSITSRCCPSVFSSPLCFISLTHLPLWQKFTFISRHSTLSALFVLVRVCHFYATLVYFPLMLAVLALILTLPVTVCRQSLAFLKRPAKLHDNNAPFVSFSHLLYNMPSINTYSFVHYLASKSILIKCFAPLSTFRPESWGWLGDFFLKSFRFTFLQLIV